jgi:hypothetical protein
MDRHHHWNTVYTSKRENEVSWLESLPTMSLRMIESAGLTRETCLIDIGGAEFVLVDAVRYVHHTPWGTTQSSQYSRFTRLH